MDDEKFQFYKPLPFREGYGFILPDGARYFYDEYGGWVDDRVWYNPDGIAQGL